MPEVERRIAECDVKIENCETRIGTVKETGEDLKYLKQRLKDLTGVRKGLVAELPAVPEEPVEEVEFKDEEAEDEAETPVPLRTKS